MSRSRYVLISKKNFFVDSIENYIQHLDSRLKWKVLIAGFDDANITSSKA